MKRHNQPTWWKLNVVMDLTIMMIDTLNPCTAVSMEWLSPPSSWIFLHMLVWMKSDWNPGSKLQVMFCFSLSMNYRTGFHESCGEIWGNNTLQLNDITGNLCQTHLSLMERHCLHAEFQFSTIISQVVPLVPAIKFIIRTSTYEQVPHTGTIIPQ